jgi:uncharacterized membrane protein YsdA (DUF1294 family)
VSDRADDERADERVADRRTRGWREVLLVASAVVGLVLGLAVATSVLPIEAQHVVFRTPLAILVLIIGTIGLLAWLARQRPEA